MLFDPQNIWFSDPQNFILPVEAKNGATLLFSKKKTNMGAHSIFNLNMGLNLNISSSTFFFHLASYCSSLNSVIWCESIFRTKLRQRTQIRHLYPNMGQKLCILSSHKLPQRFYMKL